MTSTGWRTATFVLVLAGFAPHPASRAAAQQAGPALGVLFSGSLDVGTPSTIGAGICEPRRAERRPMWCLAAAPTCGALPISFITSGRRCSGDVTLAATILNSTATTSGDWHILEPPTAKPVSSSVRRWTRIRCTSDAAVHGDGLTSLQWREDKGGVTHEVQSNVVGPKRRTHREARELRVDVRWLANGEELRPAGGVRSHSTLQGRVLHWSRRCPSHHHRHGLRPRRSPTSRLETPHPVEDRTELCLSTPWKPSACALK